MGDVLAPALYAKKPPDIQRLLFIRADETLLSLNVKISGPIFSMKYIIGIFAILLLSCNRHKLPITQTDSAKKLKSSQISNVNADKEAIQSLIRNMLSWSETSKSFDLVPVLVDEKDSLCIGFDLRKLEGNILQLKKTGFFCSEFIANYDQIILALDKKMKDKKFTKWSTGELPPFNFANDVDPWCDCQDDPGSWNSVDVHVINLDKNNGELYWKWGNLGADVSQDWKDFRYKFKVKKEDGKWKISYLEGFDFNESVKTS